MTQVETAKLVAVLLAAFPAAKVTGGTSQVYEKMLADLDYVAANAAVERLIATARFMPTVAEIRDAAMTLTTGEKRPGGDAWGDVLKAVRRFGRYRDPVFDDPLVARCVAALGWVEICDSENQQADRARFIQLYDELAVSDRKDRVAGQLPAQRAYRAQLERGGVTSIGAAIKKLGGDS